VRFVVFLIDEYWMGHKNAIHESTMHKTFGVIFQLEGRKTCAVNAVFRLYPPGILSIKLKLTVTLAIAE